MSVSFQALPLATIALFALATAWMIRRAMFKGGPSGNVPSIETVRMEFARIDEPTRRQLEQLHSAYETIVPFDIFGQLCISAALTAESDASILSEAFVLAEYMDSLSFVGFILLTEEVLGLSIDDQDAGKLLTFKRLISYVESRIGELAPADGATDRVI